MTLPTPMCGSNINLQGLKTMPLDFRRLFSSDTWLLGTPEEKVSCLHLWCESWSQIPAGSLPNDERLLALLSGSGERWKRIRNHCMRGWVLCSDGRYYHPVVVEKAVDIWSKLWITQEKGRKGAQKRWGDSTATKDDGTATQESGAAIHELWPSQGSENGTAMAMKSNEMNRSEEKRKEAKKNESVFIPPPWVPLDAWNGFVEMRTKTKRPMTPRAMSLAVKDLETLRAKGNDPGKVLDQSTLKNWMGLFPLADFSSGRPQPPSKQQALEERNRAAIDEWLKGKNETGTTR